MRGQDGNEIVTFLMWPSSLRRAGHTKVDISTAEPLFEALQSVSLVEGLHMGRRLQLPCKLIPTSPFWSGKPREWCPVHQGFYRGSSNQPKVQNTSNSTPKRCSEADDLIDFILASDIPVIALVPEGQEEMSAEEYCDVGIWIGLPPSINTLNDKNFFPGIHVHARKTMEGQKLIDKNYCAVRIKDRTGRFPQIPAEGLTITPPAALELLYFKELTCPVNTKAGLFPETNSTPRSLVQLTENVFCEHCHSPHEDIGDIFGEMPHKTHLCGQCGRLTKFEEPCIGNPLAIFIQDEVLRERVETRDPHLSQVEVDSTKLEVMIWPSTPAVFWSREAPEVWGIHVHCFDRNGVRVIDDTFGRVFLDGQELDRRELFRDMLIASEWMAEEGLDIQGEELEDD